jgi:homotetrameric cytidine deaminase
MITWEKLLSYSHCRYSGHQRASVILGDSGKIYPGVRIENASFPLSITEYQSALFGCLSEGDSPRVLYLPPHAQTSELSDIFVENFGLKVEHVESIPDQQNGTIITDKPSNVRNTLIQIQSNCRIEESNFPVSCLLETKNGQWISGVNIEFRNWQLGLCAERTALAKAISNGFRFFNSIHINAQKGQFISPCGACRQVLVEHMPYNKIVLYHPDGTQSEHTPAELLPAFFSGESIN